MTTYGLDQKVLLKISGTPARVLDVYAGGKRLIKVHTLVVVASTSQLLPDTLFAYLVEHEECTPNEATKLMKLWRKKPDLIPTAFHHHYKEQLK